MKRLVISLVILLIFLLPVKVFADGSNPNKRKHRKRTRPAATKTVATPMSPAILLYAPIGVEQVIVNCWGEPALVKQAIRQEGEKLVPLQKDGTIASKFDDPLDQSKAEKIISTFHTNQAMFLSASATRRSVRTSTIALNKKGGWSEADLQALSKLLEELFAPYKVSWIPTALDSTNKAFIIPPNTTDMNASLSKPLP